MTFLTPADPRWTEALSSVEHDVYHLPAYAELEADRQGGRAVLYHARYKGSQLLVPLVLRPVPDCNLAAKGWQDGVSPYGYASPLTDADDPEVVGCLIAHLLSACRHERIVSLFLRFHPLLPFPVQHQAIRTTPTVAVRLDVDLDTMWSHIRENHRRDIARLEYAGWYVQVDHWERLDDFVLLYEQTMARVGASDSYRFSTDYFRSLREVGDVHVGAVVSPRGEVGAAGLFLRSPRSVSYHLGGSSAEHRYLAPSKLLLYGMGVWAKKGGASSLLLGGGVGGHADSVFRFKEGFSDLRTEYRTLPLVVNQQVYSELISKRELKDPDPLSRSGFFPEYRAAPPASQSTALATTPTASG